MRNLIPSYITNDTLATTTTVVNLARALTRGDMNGALRLLQEFLYGASAHECCKIT